MKLIDILSGTIIVEVSEKVIKQLVDKFSKETQDKEETIVSVIKDFEKIKDSLPTDKRNLFDYSYVDLNRLVKLRSRTKKLSDTFNDFKKAEGKLPEGEAKTPNPELRGALRKYFDIQSEIQGPEKKLEFFKNNYLKLFNFLQKNYENLLIGKILPKYQRENPATAEVQIVNYIKSYIDKINELDPKFPGIEFFTLEEIEHMVDAIDAKKGLDKQEKTTTEDIDTVYDDGELIIFEPKDKDQCIRLAQGRTWCTSRLGSYNYYYNYRLTHGRTLYYVIDKSKDFDDRYFANVILVDRNGNTSFADKTNSYPYDGGVNLPWEQISGFIPALADKKKYFVPRPLSREEIEMREKYQNVRVPANENLIDRFGSIENVELWMEISSEKLSDFQYANLPEKLQKKYVGLGFDLTPQQIKDSPSSVLDYLIKKRVEKISTMSLSQLTGSDIALLNSPKLKELKERRKKDFASELTSLQKGSEKFVINDFESGNIAKFISLYGLENIFDGLPDSLTEIDIRSSNYVALTIPSSIGRFKNLKSLVFENCIDRLPDEICELKNLRFLSAPDNKLLTYIPTCIADLPKLVFLNVEGSPNVEVPERIKEKGDSDFSGVGIYSFMGDF